MNSFPFCFSSRFRGDCAARAGGVHPCRPGAWIAILALLPYGISAQETAAPTPTPISSTYTGYPGQSYGSSGSYGASGSSFGSTGFGSGTSTLRSRRTSRSSSSSSSSSASRTTAPAQASRPSTTASKAPAPAARPTSGQGKVISGKTASKGGGRVQLGDFQLRADNTIAIIHLDPLDSTVARDQEFVTGFHLSNPTGKQFDEVRLAVRYERDYVEPVSVRDVALKGLLAAPSKVSVHPREGVLIYTARLSSPFATVSDSLFEIRWKALRLTPRAQFQFVIAENKPSGLWLGRQDVLGDEEQPMDGLINGSVQIITPEFFEAMARRLRGAGGTMSAMAQFDEEDDMDTLPAGKGGVVLSLRGPKKPVRTGETFQVDLVFDNSADSLVDGLDIYLRYDPEVLEVLDFDQDNWITRGINILDGPYHQEFPFDYHIANQVYPSRGEIVYRVGIGDAQKLRHRVGAMATITFRAKAPVPSTAVSFRLPDSPREVGTRVTYLSESVLGRRQSAASGLREFNLRVVN